MRYLTLCMCLVMFVISSYGCSAKGQDEKLVDDSKQIQEFTDKEIVEDKFKQLITYCKENQDIITAVSEEMLEIVSISGDKAITNYNFEEVIDSIENPDYELLTKTIKLNPPSGDEIEENKVFYFNCSLNNGIYKLGVLYIKENEVDIEEYLKVRYKSIDRIEKITNSIYVTLEETMEN